MHSALHEDLCAEGAMLACQAWRRRHGSHLADESSLTISRVLADELGDMSAVEHYLDTLDDDTVDATADALVDLALFMVTTGVGE
tara:strand:+ start:444 stop:698 length:255 start_codon:yes stop_codon:yes gene_type:complete